MSDTVEMDGQNHQIKNVRIWEHGAESVGFNYQTVTSHYKAAIFSGNTVNRLTTQNRSNTQLHIVTHILLRRTKFERRYFRSCAGHTTSTSFGECQKVNEKNLFIRWSSVTHRSAMPRLMPQN